MKMQLPQFWQKKTWLSYLLLPLSGFFLIIITIRRLLYQRKILKVYRPPVPIVVVGNISVGGNGKTPLVIALAQKCLLAGWQVGIISRGYGGTITNACEVTANSDPKKIGDEPLLMAQKTKARVFIAKKRVAAVEKLLKQYPKTDMIISDDGLQHYALARDIEIIAIAADLGLGNQFLLPAGALREMPSRLKSATLVVQTGEETKNYGKFTLKAIISGAYPLQGGDVQPFIRFFKQKCYALTAIARPERFFHTLEKAGITLIDVKYLPDHASIDPQDTHFARDGVLFVSEKDAVKMNWQPTVQQNIWVVNYQVAIPQQMWNFLYQKLYLLINGEENRTT